MEIYRNLNYILSYILYRLYFKNQKNYFLNPIQKPTMRESKWSNNKNNNTLGLKIKMQNIIK